jgi:hypothetical protein
MADSLYLLEDTIKDAWRSQKVLFIGVGRPPPKKKVVTKRLLHNMKTRSIPKDIIDFTELVLTDGKTQLHFDAFALDWIDINNGRHRAKRFSLHDPLHCIQRRPG